jgi:hypothetical protein
MLYQNMLLLHQVCNYFHLFLYLNELYLGASTLYLCGGDFPNGMFVCFLIEETKNELI